MTVIRWQGLTWVAPKDGTAHADPHDATFRALCGAMPVADRFAWPTVRLCPTCVERAGKRAPKGGLPIAKAS